MKITFVVDQMRTGGAERVAANLSNQFASLGHDVCIVMLNETEEYSHYRVTDNVKLIPIKRTYRKNNPIRKTILLKKCIGETSPDVVISFLNRINIYTHFALWGLNIPHIVSERNDPKRYPSGKLIRVLRNYVFKKANGCVFQTADAQGFFLPYLKKRSVIIPNPVVLMYEPEPKFKREKKITAAGRLESQKNYAMMIRAFALFSEKNPEYELVICGEGSLRNEISALIEELELEDKVVLMGQVENPHEIIYNSAVFALSSDNEGMPNALLEAMALGVPSVSTDCPCGGPAELIKDGENGMLVPVGDSKAMAEVFDRITSSAEFSDKLSANAREIRQVYSVENIAAKWLEYIENVIANRK